MAASRLRGWRAREERRAPLHARATRVWHLLSLLLQLLGLHALLDLREQGRAGGGRALQAPLLCELIHLALQLPAGEPHLLQLQLALVQLSERQQTGVRLAKPKPMRDPNPGRDSASGPRHPLPEKCRGGRNVPGYRRRHSEIQIWEILQDLNSINLSSNKIVFLGSPLFIKNTADTVRFFLDCRSGGLWLQQTQQRRACSSHERSKPPCRAVSQFPSCPGSLTSARQQWPGWA